MKLPVPTLQVPIFSAVSRTLLCLLATCLALCASSYPARAAQTAAQISSDAAEVGRVQAFRAQLLKKKNANEISDAEYKREDYAADSIVVHLNNQYSYRGEITNTFLAQANQVSRAILADPAAHQAELDQAAAEVEKEAGSVAQMDQQIIDESKKLATQPSHTTTTPSNGGIQVLDDGVKKQTTPEPVSKPASGALPIVSIAIVLLLLAACAAAYILLHMKRKKPPTVAYADVKASATVPSPSPATRVAPSRPASVTSPPAAALAAAGSLKDRLFAEQKQKYQTRYNDASDELTNATAELAQAQSVIEGIQTNLKLLSRTLQNRVHALVMIQNSGVGGVLLGALIAKPLWRLLHRAGLILKLVVIAALGAFAYWLYGLVMSDQLPAAITAYALFLAAMFVFERHLRLKVPLAACRKYSEKLKDLSLAYIYDDQTTHLPGNSTMLPLLRVVASKTPPTEEFAVSSSSWAANLRPDSFLLYAGDMAVFRMERNGGGTLLFCNPNDDGTKNYCRLLATALGEQTSFAASTFDPLVTYANAAWHKRQAAEALPRLENQLHGAGKIEAMWRNTYVSDPVISFLMRRIDLFNVRDTATPMGILFYGLEGNGKTHLARKVAESISARFEQVNAATLTSAQEVKSLWEKSRGKGPVVLFAADAERIFPKPGSENQGSGTREATLAWIDEWGKMEPRQSQVWVIMTSQSEAVLHPAIASQFGGSKIEVTNPDDTGRALLLRSACVDNQISTALPDWLLSATAGRNVHALRELVKEAKMQCAPNPPSDADWHKAAEIVFGYKDKDTSKTWDHLILPKEIKDQLIRSSRAVREADRYKAKGIDVPNILLFGPPGTGKTEIARTLANESGVQFFMAGTADVKGEYVGQSAPKVQKIFAEARASAPSVLFIDEFETLAGRRDSSGTDSFGKDIVTQMLAEMDGARTSDRPVFVLAATNFPELIDKAMLSRFRQIEVPLPDEQARCQILKGAITDRAKKGAVDPKMDIDEIAALLASRTPLKSGRDLVHMVADAMSRAVEGVDSIDDAFLTRDLLIEQVTPKARVVSDEDLEKVWSTIVLKPQVKQFILSKVRMFNNGDKAAPKGLLLFGPPGTGKTEIAKKIAESTRSEFKSLKGSDLKSGYAGQSGQSVKKIWEEARARDRCVIFVDECDGVFGRRGSFETDKATEEVVPEFLASWGGMDSAGQIWVVGATNHRERLDEAIVQRFGAAVEITLPDAPARMEILHIEMEKYGRKTTIPDFMAELSTGMAGRELSKLAEEVCALAEERRSEITPEMWKDVAQRRSDTPGLDKDATWENLVLADSVIKRFQTVCKALRKIEVLRKQGVTLTSSVLLYGPPGTGKTQIARTLANESGLPCIFTGPSDFKAGWVGQSAPKVHEVFERARAQAPCILFIDEADAIFPGGGGGTVDQFTPEIVNQARTELDGAKKDDRFVFVLAAANNPERIDEPILSRFNERIEIPNPDPDQRRRLLKIMISKSKVDFDVDQVAGELAALTNHCGGRDLASLVKNASQLAVQRALDEDTADNIILTRSDLMAQIHTAPSDSSRTANMRSDFSGRAPVA